jgi:hypothetical protein
MFSEPLRAAVGKVVERDGFYFADLVPDVAMVEVNRRLTTRCSGPAAPAAERER